MQNNMDGSPKHHNEQKKQTQNTNVEPSCESQEQVKLTYDDTMIQIRAIPADIGIAWMGAQRNFLQW